MARCAQSALLVGSVALLWSQAAFWTAARFGPEVVEAVGLAGARGVAALGQGARAAGGWGWQALQALASLASSLAALAWEHRDKAARGARATWRAARRAAASGWERGQDLLVWLRVCQAARRAEDVRRRELAAASTALEYALVEMALAGGVAVGAAAPCWVLVSRGGEWDEVLIFGQAQQKDYGLGLTTDATGMDFVWVLVRLLPGHFRAAVVPGGGALRVAPFGVPGGAVNWVCEPPHAAAQWSPSLAELAALRLEAQGVDAALLNVVVPAGVVVDAGAQLPSIPAFMSLGGPLPPAAGGALVAAPPPGAAAAAGAFAPGVLAAGLGAGAAAPAAAGGLGFAAVGMPDAAAAAGAAGAPLDLAAMLQEVRSLQTQLQGGGGSKDKKKKKDKKSDKKKKKKKKRDSSDSSSSAGDSSTSSSSDYLRWRGPKSKSRRVAPAQERKLETEKFKAKGDLLAFAAKHPGALSGYFLAMVHRKLSHGRLTETKQLRQASVTTWAAAHSGLTELRDQREVQTLALVIDLINARDLATAMDVLAQRIIAIQRAKTKGGSWEKAETVELLTGTGGGVAAGGLLKLTM